MSRPHFLAYFLLGSLLTTRGRADRITSRTIKDNDLRQDCAFELDGHEYNLCPLVGKRILVEVDAAEKRHEEKGEGPSSRRRFYEVALGGLDDSSYSTRVTSVLEGSGCDKDTWVCMLGESGYRAGKFPGYSWSAVTYRKRGDVEEGDRQDIIAGNMISMPKAPRADSIAREGRRNRKTRLLKSTLSLNIQGEESKDDSGPLHLSLYGGMLDNRRQSAEITFLCSEVERLRYVREARGVYFFSWSTSHGCSTKSARDIRSDFVAADESDSGSKDPAPEEKQGDDDLMPLDNGRIRRWIAIIVVVLVSGLAVGAVLLSSSRARSLATENVKSATYVVLPLLAQIYTKLSPLGNSISRARMSIVHVRSRFRQKDSRLVLWAQEDMSLLDSEDIMVNGSGAMGREDDWNANGMEEFIPLTSNPQHGRRAIRSYGATPDVETFAERGALSGLAKYFHR